MNFNNMTFSVSVVAIFAGLVTRIVCQSDLTRLTDFRSG
jgi:hypothetical protein